jgi:hypothetical protein
MVLAQKKVLRPQKLADIYDVETLISLTCMWSLTVMSSQSSSRSDDSVIESASSPSFVWPSCLLFYILMWLRVMIFCGLELYNKSSFVFHLKSVRFLGWSRRDWVHFSVLRSTYVRSKHERQE